MSAIAATHFCQPELNLRLRRGPERIANDVREMEQLLAGLGRLTAAQIEELRPEWREKDHRYVRLLAEKSMQVLSAPGVGGYALERTLTIEELEHLAGARQSQIKAMASTLIRLRRLIALRKAAAAVTQTHPL